MKKLLIVFVVFLMVCSTIFANGVSEETTKDQRVEILFWHTFSEGAELDNFNEVVKQFEVENPMIKVNSVRMPYEGLQQQVITAVAGGSAPDVMRMDIIWMGKMASMGALASLDEMEEFDKYKENALPVPLSTNFIKDHYYGLPLGTNTTLAIWNKDLLKENNITYIPKTIDELEKVAKEYSNPEEEKYFFTIGGTYCWTMLPWIWSLGGDISSPDFTRATGYLDSPQTIAALKRIASWYQAGLISPAIIGGQPDAWTAASSGLLPLTIEGPWFITKVDTPFEREVSLIPSGKGGSKSIVGGEDLVLFKDSKHPKEAWKFVQYLLSDKAQLKMAEAGMIPTTKTAIEKLDTSETPFLDTFIKQLESTKIRIPSKNFTEIDNYLIVVFEKIIRGELSAEDALTEAAIKVDELLK
ncbi:MAG: extracellular solute-binding protein [Sphaerochaetaceae bacterium]